MFFSIIPLSFGQDLVNYYKFNNSLLDSSGNSYTYTNNGCVFNNNVPQIPADGSYALDCSGMSIASRYVTGTAISTILSGHDFSVSSWLYANSSRTDANGMYIYNQGTSLNGAIKFYYVNTDGNGKFNCVILGGGGGSPLYYNITTNNWNHYTFIFNSSNYNMVVWLNTTYVGTTNCRINAQAVNGETSQGLSWYGYSVGNGWNGSYKNTRIFNTTINISTISQIYNAEKYVAVIPNSFTFYNSTVANNSYTYNTTPTFTINATNASAWNISLYIAPFSTPISGTIYATNSTYIANTTWSAVPTTQLTKGRQYYWWFTANSNATNYVNSSINNIFVAGKYTSLGGFFVANKCNLLSSNSGYYSQ